MAGFDMSSLSSMPTGGGGGSTKLSASKSGIDNNSGQIGGINDYSNNEAMMGDNTGKMLTYIIAAVALLAFVWMVRGSK